MTLPEALTHTLTRLAFVAAFAWLVVLTWLEATGRLRSRTQRVILAVRVLFLLWAIAILTFG
jgi:hypothetical protein